MKRRSVSPPAPQTAAEPSLEPRTKLSPALQVGLSVVLGLHVLAVIAGPFTFATTAAGNSSPAASPLYYVLRPYIALMYLDHGYFFFAPNPGESHLVRYELEFADGREPIVGEFPDQHEQWPRLLYHRHFMLSETLHNFYRPTQGPPEPPPPSDDSRRARRAHDRDVDLWQRLHADWEMRRALYKQLQESIGGHLKHQYGASDVILIRREHRPLDPPEVSEDRMKLTDEATYRNLPEVPAAEELPWNPSPSR